MSYKARVIDEAIERRLKNKGAILVEGAKWCGKTTTCEQHAASVLYMSDPDRVRQSGCAGRCNNGGLYCRNKRLRAQKYQISQADGRSVRKAGVTFSCFFAIILAMTKAWQRLNIAYPL